MLGYSVVNSKGQVTIPASIRKELGIKPGKTVLITKSDDKISISASEGYKSLRGIIKTDVKTDFKKMREMFHEYYGTRKRK